MRKINVVIFCVVVLFLTGCTPVDTPNSVMFTTFNDQDLEKAPVS